jgi:RHS repeat-associated protein
MTTTKQHDNLNRLSSISSATTPVVSSAAYLYNKANQRTKRTDADGSYWDYGYDTLGQVVSGSRKWSDTTPVAGQQFGYDFDDIGNRQTTQSGGWSSISTNSINSLNQYTQRTVPGNLDVLGTAEAAATVTVNNQPTVRQGEYFQKTLPFDNSSAAQYPEISIVGVRKNAGPGGVDVVTEETGNKFLAKTPEVFTHDADGNLTGDGRWVYTWDAENRLIAMETVVAAVTAGTPKQKLEFAYDHQSRRIEKKVYLWDTPSSTYQLQSTLRFIYDGWNLIAELDASSALVRSYVWGLDLSDDEQGAGGVGGLLFTSHVSASKTYFAAFDGNGNLTALADAADGSVAAEYEYSPFGETLRATGAAATSNPFRFSTKYTDAETGLLYYGYRYYQPSTGRWLSRDPIEEVGQPMLEGVTGEEPEEGEWTPENPYNFCFNDSISHYDVNGEWVGPVLRVGRQIIGPIIRSGRVIIGKIGTWHARRKARQLAIKIAECTAIHASYSKLNCQGCGKCMYREEAAKNAVCLTAEIAGRELYLKKKCDYVLPGSIARGSARAESGHRIQVTVKKKALATCVALAATLPPTPPPPATTPPMP